MTEVKATMKELESFKRTILELVPAANRIAKSVLSRRKKQFKLEPKSVDFARWVLQQYAKFALPDNPDQQEVHIIDHAMLAQMEQAKDIVAEMNAHANKSRFTDRGLDIEPN